MGRTTRIPRPGKNLLDGIEAARRLRTPFAMAFHRGASRAPHQEVACPWRAAHSHGRPLRENLQQSRLHLEHANRAESILTKLSGCESVSHLPVRKESPAPRDAVPGGNAKQVQLEWASCGKPSAGRRVVDVRRGCVGLLGRPEELEGLAKKSLDRGAKLTKLRLPAARRGPRKRGAPPKSEAAKKRS